MSTTSSARRTNEWSSTAAYAQQRREFAMRKERDFLLAVKAREERAASRGISTGTPAAATAECLERSIATGRSTAGRSRP